MSIANECRKLKISLKEIENEMVINTNYESIVSKIVIGFVSPLTNDISSIFSFNNGKWRNSKRTPTIYIPECCLPLFINPKRFMVLFGGRGSSKSITAAIYSLITMLVHKTSLMCAREFWSSIEDSVHKLLKSEIERINLPGFKVTDRKIVSPFGDSARFTGLHRNPDSVKSAHGFKLWWIEEGQFITDNTLKLLTPTVRNKPSSNLPGVKNNNSDNEMNAQLLFTVNPGSSEDAFSKRFLKPFQDELDEKGIYEDDMHLIIRMNYYDNPWFAESGLDDERKFDKQYLSSSAYECIWLGTYNDYIEDGLILAEWFDACVDAHKKLGMKEFGKVVVSHDPSDLGSDAKSVCVRKGNIITTLDERDDMDVNEGSDWAVGIAINENADVYTWDCGGMGVALKKDVNLALKDLNVDVYQFLGQSKVDNPDGIYNPSGADNIKKEKTNKEVCRNLRVQCYLSLRDRIYRTYQAVVNNKFCDPALLISFSSDCNKIKKLRSELSRIPIKLGLKQFDLYSKPEMMKKFSFKSPNLADAVMMTERTYNNMKKNIELNTVIKKTLSYW